jgi:hypothetical protein
MRIVIGAHHLISFAGMDTYLVTVAEALQKLGHDVTVHALEQGEMADIARERGVEVPRDAAELPAGCDVTFAQDTITAYDLAERYPRAPQVFVAHSDMFSLDRPPQLPGITAAVVVMSERMRRMVEAMALRPPITRLRQPIDTHRFQPSGHVRPQARRAVVIGNYLYGRRLDVVREACERAGLELDVYGRGFKTTANPEIVMSDADIVIGRARVILEAMACARAAYLLDFAGTDGWVTPQRYPAMEADAFGGVSREEVTDGKRIASELAAYDADMGIANRDLVVRHHRVLDHAYALVELFEGLEPAAGRPAEGLGELSRLSRQSWLAESAAHELRRRNDELRAEIDELREHEEHARLALTALHEFRQSRRYRLANALGYPARLWRRVRGRG